MIQALTRVLFGVHDKIPGVFTHWLVLEPQGTDDISAGLFFYTTFSTSLWLWLFTLGGALLRLTDRVGNSWSAMKDRSDIDSNPYQSLGYAAMLLVTLVFFVLVPVAYGFHWVVTQHVDFL